MNLLLCALLTILRLEYHLPGWMLSFVAVLAWTFVLGVADQIRRPRQ